MPKLGLILLALVPCYLQSAYYVKDSYTYLDPTYNSIGQTGLIHLPTASLQEDGTVGVTFGDSSINKFISVIATPFPWLEASFFYHRPRDTIYIKKDKYLDKGFNLKLGFNYSGIDFALGIDDVAGTGFLSKEYLAATFNNGNFAFTLGIGTGAYASDHPLTNPISSLRDRPGNKFSEETAVGGELDLNTFFRGPIGIFGGIEFNSSRIPGLTFKIENNPFDYEGNFGFLGGGAPTLQSIIKRKKEKDFNYGVYYKFKNDFNFSISKIKGNTFDFMLSKKFFFNGPKNTVKPKKTKKVSESKDNEIALYQNILRNLESDDLFLQSAQLEENKLRLAIVNNKYNNPVQVFEHTKLVVTELVSKQDLKISNLEITNINSGIETAKISGKTINWLNPDKIGSVEINEPTNDTNLYNFQTILSFPEFYNTFEPEFIYRYGDPTRFFAGGVDIQLNSEIKFSPDTYLTTALSYQLLNSFERLRYYPDSPYLPHVRTDVVQYLNNRPDLYLNNIQLDKLSKISNGHYVKFSAGMYEMMFGGYGAEYLWKPFRSNFSIGMSLYKVKQRDFEQRLKFGKYKTSTGHINFIKLFPYTGIEIDLSIGKYLAGDIGYTVDFSRRFKSGFKMGAYFTRTDISKIEYGEGSFDKGFYFDIPLNVFQSNAGKGITNFIIQPLTRDGGAKLKTTNPLLYSIQSGSEIDYKYYLD